MGGRFRSACPSFAYAVHPRLIWRLGVLIALTAFALTLGVLPAFAGQVTIVGEGDQILASIEEDSFYEVTLTATDAWGDQLYWFVGHWTSGITPPQMEINSDTITFRYTPPADYNGAYNNVAYASVFDKIGASSTSDSVNIFVEVTPVNDPPVIIDGPATFQFANEDTPMSFTLDASDIDGDALNWSVTTPPTGLVNLTPGPGGQVSVDYIPSTEFFGSDPFTLTVSDGIESADITVFMEVLEVNDPPIIFESPILPVWGNEDEMVSFSLHGFDVEGPMLWIPLAFSNGNLSTGSTDGGLTLDVQFTPDADFWGSAPILMQLSDGSDTAIVLVDLMILPANDPPVVQDDTNSGAEDTVVSGNLLGNDSDIDGDTLLVSDCSGTPVPAGGSAVVPLATGSLTIWSNGDYAFTPLPDMWGNAVNALQFTVSDGTASETELLWITIDAVADAPVLTEGASTSVSTAEDTLLTATLHATDADGDTLACSISSAASNGVADVTTLDGGATLDVIYTPDANYNGPDSFDVTVSDGTNTDVITVQVTVDPVNDVPDWTNDSAVGLEDTTISGNVLDNDSDIDGDILHIHSLGPVLVIPPFGSVTEVTPAGTTTLYWDGRYDFTPAANLNGPGTRQFIAWVADAGYVCPNLVTIDVLPVNDPPQIAEGMAISPSILEDNVMTATLHASDVDGDPLSCSISSAAWNGVAQVTSADGGATLDVVYTPDPNYFGPDAFDVMVSDGVETTLITVNVTVDAVDDPPFVSDDVASGFEDVTVYGNLLDNDSDIEGDPLRVAWVASDLVVPGGSVSQFRPEGALTVFWDGRFEFVPAPGANGTPYFTFTAIVTDDLTGPYIDTVTINLAPVNDAPQVLNGDSLTLSTDEDVPLGYLLSGFDPDGDSLSWSISSGPGNGGVVLDPQLGGTVCGMLYTPAPDFNGADSFDLTVTDGVDADVITINVAVNPVNDAPAAADDVYMLDEGGTLIIPAPGLLGNDTDAEGEALAAIIDSYPANGSLLPFPNGSFLYVPNAEFQGTDTFTYCANDNTYDSAVAAVTIQVTAIADDPVIVQGSSASMGTAEDTAADFTLDATDADSGAVLTWSLASQPNHGAVSIGGTGTSKTLTYTPEADYSGPDSFNVKVADETGRSDTILITVDVAAVNDQPVAAEDFYTVEEGGILSVGEPGILANDLDVDGDALSALLSTLPSHFDGFGFGSGGSFTYIPVPGFSGTDSFEYIASDGAEAALVTVYIEVLPLNDAPYAMGISNDTVAENEAAGTLVGMLDAQDTDSVAFTYSIVSATDAFEIVGGELRATRPFDYEAETSLDVTVRADDGDGGTFDQAFTVYVSDVDEAPVALADEFSATEDAALIVPAQGVLANDSDPEGAMLGASLVGDVSNGALTFDADGGFTYTPDTGYSGTDSFTYEASDGTLASNVTQVTILVGAANDVPSSGSDAYSTDEDVVLDVAAPGLFANDSDPDGDSLIASAVQTPAHGSVTFGADGAFAYTPSRGWSGVDYFTYRVSDGSAFSNISTVTITVASVDTSVNQIAGADRVGTAVEVSRESFPHGASTVVIATSQNWPDALGGAALAGAVDGPILLTRPDAITADVLAEINRLGATDAYILGGPAAISSAVEDALDAAMSGDVVRLGGATRYDTAGLVAAQAVAISGGADGVAFLAKGTNFPDALAASPLAAFKAWPIYLAGANGVSAETKAAMTAAGVDTVIVLGSDAAVSQASEADLVAAGFDTERVSGVDRYATAVSVAEYGVSVGLTWDVLTMATGQNFPDGLSGGVLAAKRGAVMLLNPRDVLHPAVHDAVRDNRMFIDDVYYLGGTNAISPDVRGGIASLLR